MLALSASAYAQDKPEKLVILSHKVHQTVATGEQGGDITADWQEENGVGVEWVTMDTGPLHERMFRELALPETSIDIAFLLNTRAVESVTKLLEPLNAHQQQAPIEDIRGRLPGAGRGDDLRWRALRRAVPPCLDLLPLQRAHAGGARASSAPTTMEELVDAAYKLTYEAADGTQVHGFVITGDNYANIVDIARAWDGDFITLDYELAVTGPGMTRAAQTLADFYDEGRAADQLGGDQERGRQHLAADRPGGDDHDLLRPQPDLQRPREVARRPATSRPSRCRSARTSRTSSRWRRPRSSSGAW